MERMTWMTEERYGAPAAGAPTVGRVRRSVAMPSNLPIHKQAGFVPTAFGPGLVCGNATSTIRTARHGMPLRSPGAGFG